MNTKENSFIETEIYTTTSSDCRSERAFTFVELLVVLAIISAGTLMVLSAMAKTKTNGSMSRCLNNLKQLASAWTMYSADNNGSLVSAYPSFGGFTATWCKGNAATGGGAGSYMYGGADPAGITNGLLWPYIKSLSAYKCPADNRVSFPGNPLPGQPILRNVSMNSYMAGRSWGVTPAFTITFGGARNPTTPVFLKETEISRPSSIWVILDEDPQSINDGMFLVDLGGGQGFLDLPSRLHNNSYGINFADNHVELIKFTDSSSITWTPGATVINNDWRRLTNITTAPLN
ncbi:MAG: prepilin-type N-terminal cleavage/methylation domain-containing protein [Verrucomicrobiota bacterium]|nr:prepilin-type N-terminal cleavage/methylation domain-containing protein [Verrucomicrobiota bacterium]